MSSVPEHCQEQLQKCKSTARIGCTVNAMRAELRRRGVQGVSALKKNQLCQLLHAVHAKKARAPQKPTTDITGVFPEKCVRPQVCNTRAPSGCGVVNLRDHIRRTDPDVKGVWKMNKSELCKQLRAPHPHPHPAVQTHTKPIPHAASPVGHSKPSTIHDCMTDFTVKNLRPLLANLNFGSVWKMTKEQLCKQLVTAPRKVPKILAPKVPAPPKVNYIWKNALRLSGPIGATVFQLPHNKQIYLFGDDHGGIKFQCPKNDKDAIGIVDLLVQTFASRPGPENTDMFIETWNGGLMDDQVKSFAKKGVERDAMLAHVDRRFRGEFTKRAKNAREFPSTRVHYADPRHTTFKLDGYEVSQFWNDSFVKKYMDSSAKAKEYFKLFVMSDNFAADMRALVPAYKGKETRHAIRKQILKLEAKDQNFLLERVDKELDYVFTAVNDELFEKYRKAFTSTSKESRDIAVKITQKIAGDIGRCLMDTYLLARLIYYVKKQTVGGLTVVYVGENHKVNYANVLAKHYGPPVFNRNEIFGLDKRCINLGPTQNKKHELSELDRFWDKGGPIDRMLLSKL